jgi:serine/threonine protein kinase/WD40 repeat protein
MSPCPSRQQLQSLLEGAADGSLEKTLTDHVEACVACQQALEELTTSSLLGATNTAPRPPHLAREVGRFAKPSHEAGHSGEKSVDAADSPGEPSRHKLSDLQLHRLRHLLPPGRSTPGVEPSGEPAESQWPAIPGYEVLRELGRGGMAIVYEARQLRLNRRVALKMILAGAHATPEQLVRFCSEGEIVARFRHPNIVQIYEVGTYNCQPFFALELMEGGSLAAAQGGKPLPARIAAGLVETLARTMEYAHRQGIVHRDLNPANILLQTVIIAEDAVERRRNSSDSLPLPSPVSSALKNCIPKISDFGLAKHLDHDSRLTQTGHVMGTPSYMAPEQVRGQNDRVGPAADVYALGAILYELLTGRPPFQAPTTLEVMNQVSDLDPVPPSRLLPQVPRDLEVICLKCLEKEPSRRYGSAEASADDLRRFLDHLPIQARRVATMERAWQWAKRRPTVAALLLAVVVALLGGTGVSTYFAVESSRRADEAERATQAKQRALDSAEKARLQSDRRAAELQWRAGLAQCEAGAVDLGLFTLLNAWRWAPEDAGEFRRVLRANLAAWSCQLPVLQHAFPLAQGGEVLARFVGPEGRTLVTWTGSGPRLDRWDTATGTALGAPFFLPDGEVAVDVSPDGTLLSTRKHDQGFIRNLTNGQLVVSGLRHRTADNQADPVFPLFAAGGRVVVTSGKDYGDRWGFRRFWQLAPTLELPVTLQLRPGDTYDVTSGRDGKMVLVVFRQSTRGRLGDPPPHAEFWDLAAGNRLSSFPAPIGGSDPRIRWQGDVILSLDREGAVLFPEGADGSVFWWNTATGQLYGELGRPRRRAPYSTLSEDSQLLTARCEDQRVRLYDLATDQQRGGDIPATGYQGHEWAGRVAASPDGSVVLTTTVSGTIRLWQTRHFLPQTTAAANPRPWSATGEPEIVTSAFSADGKTAVVCQAESYHQGWLVETSSGRPRGRPLRQQHLHFVAFSPDGALIATAPNNHEYGGKEDMYLWDAATGHLRTPLHQYRYIHALAFSPDSRTLAVGCVGGTFLWDVATARPRHFLRERTAVGHLLFSPDGRRLAVAYKVGWSGVGAGLRLWDVTTGQPVGEFLAAVHPQRPQPYFVMAFAEDGRTLRAFDTYTGILHTLDARTGKPRGQPVPLEQVDQAVFSADGEALAMSQPDGSVQQWEPPTGQRIGPPLAQPHSVTRFVYSPDRRMLAVAYRDHAVRVWDVATSLPVGPPLPHRTPVLDLTFTPDCASLVTLTMTGRTYTWPMPRLVADDPDRMEVWLQANGGSGPRARKWLFWTSTRGSSLEIAYMSVGRTPTRRWAGPTMMPTGTTPAPRTPRRMVTSSPGFGTWNGCGRDGPWIGKCTLGWDGFTPRQATSIERRRRIARRRPTLPARACSIGIASASRSYAPDRSGQWPCATSTGWLLRVPMTGSSMRTGRRCWVNSVRPPSGTLLSREQSSAGPTELCWSGWRRSTPRRVNGRKQPRSSPKLPHPATST